MRKKTVNLFIYRTRCPWFQNARTQYIDSGILDVEIRFNTIDCREFESPTKVCLKAFPDFVNRGRTLHEKVCSVVCLFRRPLRLSCRAYEDSEVN
jgi:hypothetical protein